MCPQSLDWKPFHLFNRLSGTKDMRLECKDRPRTLVAGKDTDATRHMKSWHYTKLPIDCWTIQLIELKKIMGTKESAI